MKKHVRRRGSRKLRPRPRPKFLEKPDLDEMAQRRCLMILSVLSGEKPVTEAVSEAGITRQTYYQLEMKALKAMVASMMPGASEDPSRGGDGMARQVEALQTKVAQLERKARRAERMLRLTREVVKPGPMTTGRRGRPKGSKNRKKTGTRTSSRVSPDPSESTSPPMPGGGDVR